MSVLSLSLTSRPQLPALKLGVWSSLTGCHLLVSMFVPLAGVVNAIPASIRVVGIDLCHGSGYCCHYTSLECSRVHLQEWCLASALVILVGWHFLDAH